MEIVNISFLFITKNPLDPTIYDFYNPKRFSGAILSRGKTRILVFKGRKIVVTGVTDPIQAEKVVIDLVGVDEITKCVITNITAKGKIDFELDFNTMLRSNNFSWEPELFPGIYWRKKTNEKSLVIIFRSRKIIMTGLKNIEDINILYKELLEDVLPFRR